MNFTNDSTRLGEDFPTESSLDTLPPPPDGGIPQWMKTMESIVSIVVPIFFSIIVFVGFVGNLLVVLVVTFNKQMRNTTNLLIMNLAVADILFIVFCVPFSATAYAIPHDWPFGNIV